MSEMLSTMALDEDKIIVSSVQDAQPILDFCRDKRSSGKVGSSEMKHAASFPQVVIENYMNRTGVSWGEFLRDKTHIRRLLSDPDLKHFRVWDGRV